MFRARPTFLQPLLNHRPHDFIQELKADKNQENLVNLLNQHDAYGRNALQLASLKGMQDIVIWLLYAGINVDEAIKAEKSHLKTANKTSLYLALEYHHFNIAEILLACGADRNVVANMTNNGNTHYVARTLQQLRLDAKLISQLIFWMVSHYHPGFGIRLLTVLKPQIKHILSLSKANKADVIIDIMDDQKSYHQTLTIINLKELPKDIYSLLELAAFKNLTDVVITLASYLEEAGYPKFESKPSRANVGHFAVKNNNDTILELIASDDTHILHVLHHLKSAGDGQEFRRFYHKVNSNQQELYLNSVEIDSYVNLPPKQSKLAHAAIYGDVESLNAFQPNMEILDKDAQVVLQHAIEERNYVALNTFFSDNYAVVINQYNNSLSSKIKILFEYAFKTQQKHLCAWLMLVSGLDLYDLFQQFPMINLSETQKKSLLLSMVDHGTVQSVHDIRNEKEVNAQREFFRRYRVGASQFLEVYLHFHYQQIGVTTLEHAIRIINNPDELRILDRVAKRFGIFDFNFVQPSIQSSQVNTARQRFFDTPGLPNLWLAYLNDKDKARLAVTSSAMNKICNSERLDRVKHFLSRVENAIEKQLHQHNKKEAGSKSVLGFLSLSALTLSIYGLVNNKQDPGMGIVEIYGIIFSLVGLCCCINMRSICGWDHQKEILDNSLRQFPELETEAERMLTMLSVMDGFNLTMDTPLRDIMSFLEDIKIHSLEHFGSPVKTLIKSSGFFSQGDYQPLAINDDPDKKILPCPHAHGV